MRFSSLQVRITLLVSALVVVLLGAVTAIVSVDVNRSIGEFSTEENIQIALARSAELGRVLDGHYRELSAIALTPDLVKGAPAAAEAYAKSLVGKVSLDITNVLLAWPDGRATTQSAAYVDIHERPYFKGVFGEGKDYVISDPLISKNSGKPAVILAKAIKDVEGRTRAMVGMEMQLAALSEITGGIKVFTSGYGWVIDGAGSVIAHKNTDFLLKLKVTDSAKDGFLGLEALGRRMLSEPTGTGNYQKAGSPLMRTYWARVPNSPNWCLGLNVPESEVGSTAASLLRFLLIAMVVGILLAAFLAMAIARSIVRPIRLVQVAMGNLARGDLVLTGLDLGAVAKVLARKDEIGSLASSMKELRLSLTTVVSDISLTAGQVAMGANQLSTSAQGLSQGSNEQAASIEELSASVEESTATIRQNADSTAQANALARRVAVSAESSGKAVAGTVASMTEIAGKIGIIEEISRQTNLLALNAAIEAARAGEAGKGFAVVASEVRKLAERSAIAAGEINGLSRSSVAVATEAGHQLEALLPDIARTAEFLQEIAAASSEQASGAEQISLGVTQMDQVVQSNAASSEELASTAEELSAQAQRLKETVGYFVFQAAGTAQPGPAPRAKASASVRPAVTSGAPKPEVRKTPVRETPKATTLTLRAPDPKDEEFEDF